MIDTTLGATAADGCSVARGEQVTADIIADSATASRDALHAFGRDALGPIVAEYLTRLLAQARALEREQGAKILFVSRGGVRIRRALETFVRSAGATAPEAMDYLWISRFMAAKAVWKTQRASAIELIVKELSFEKLDEVIRGLTRKSGRTVELAASSPWRRERGSAFPGFLQSGEKAARVVEEVLGEQADLFSAYLEELLAGHETAMLVDTGWAGTAQSLLSAGFPQWSWWGAYFGCFGEGYQRNPNRGQMIPLMVSGEKFDPAHPETTTILHRHLIEVLFEPRGESIEHFARDASGRIEAVGADDILADAPGKEDAPLFVGVMDYLAALPDGARPAQIHRAARRAWPLVAQLSLTPTREQALWFAQTERSHDFGLGKQATMLLPTKDRYENDRPDNRVKDAIWQFGQIALEYAPEAAIALQRRISGMPRPSAAKAAATAVAEQRPRPAVAIITRTLDRPIFLSRALQSVGEQSFDDYVHVIVNDGGDNEQTRRVIERAPCDHSKTILIDTLVNRGMEAASNVGIRAVDSDFIVIHDDDDSWRPDFLEKTVAFLREPKHALYGGVIAKSVYVSEEVTADGVVQYTRSPYNDWLESVQFMQMAMGNCFPPIAFLFRRELYDSLGGFNELYPVLGDWDFNLRFLAQSNIGVVREPLANYHHRDRGDTRLFGNSVIADRNKHQEFGAIVRNGLMRHFADRGQTSYAALVAQGLHMQDMLQTLRNVSAGGSSRAPSAQPLAKSASASVSVETADMFWVALQRLVMAVRSRDRFFLAKLGRRRRKLLPWGRRRRPTEEDAAALDAALTTLLQDDRGDYRMLLPPRYFDDEAYRRLHRDVDAVVEAGGIASGFEHYYYHGRKEGRTLS